jgi:DNA-binding response OmpR family regulator
VARVLVVEDNQLLREGYKRFLEQHGHKVFVAWTVEGARWHLEKVEPEYVILDLELGGDITAGREVAELIPEGMPFAVVTGHEIDRVRPRLTRNPFASAIWLVKPPTDVEYLDLLAAIEAASPDPSEPESEPT